MTGTLRDTRSGQRDCPPSPRRQNGAAIRALREKDGWSQTALAAAAGMTQANYWRIETEAANARVESLNRIARALRVPVAAIMRELDEPNGAVA
jgi:transcriptional regulator with XRE-family HTH domain